jgi:hypothetical protein
MSDLVTKVCGGDARNSSALLIWEVKCQKPVPYHPFSPAIVPLEDDLDLF